MHPNPQGQRGDGMMETVDGATFEYGGIPPKEVRGNSRANRWVKARELKKLRVSGFWHGKGECSHLQLLRLASIQFTFYHWRKIDLDNLQIGMKGFVDGLVNSEVFIDDDPDHLQFGKPKFVKCKKGESKTVVRIEAIEGGRE